MQFLRLLVVLVGLVSAVTTTPSLAADTWVWIADMYGPFKVSGTQTVRYGVDTRWVQRSVTNSGQCQASFFGNNPAPLVPGKTCQVLVKSLCTGTAILSWNASSSDVIGYRAYHGTTSGSYLPLGQGTPIINGTSLTMTGFESGKRYYFVVTAIDAAGNESLPSNEGTKLMP